MGRREEGFVRAIAAGLTWKGAAREVGLPEERAAAFLESVACFAGCVAVGAVFMPQSLVAVLVAAVVATAVEALPAPVNDNLSVPFAAALILWLLV